MPARLFRPDLDRIAAEVLVHRNQETGGSLFGAWSHPGPPPIYPLAIYVQVHTRGFLHLKLFICRG